MSSSFTCFKDGSQIKTMRERGKEMNYPGAEASTRHGEDVSWMWRGPKPGARPGAGRFCLRRSGVAFFSTGDGWCLQELRLSCWDRREDPTSGFGIFF